MAAIRGGAPNVRRLVSESFGLVGKVLRVARIRSTGRANLGLIIKVLKGWGSVNLAYLEVAHGRLDYFQQMHEKNGDREKSPLE